MQLSKEKLYEIFVENSRRIDTVSSPGECIFVGDLKSIVRQILSLQELPDATLPQSPQAAVSGCCSQCGTGVPTVCDECVSSIAQSAGEAGYNGV